MEGENIFPKRKRKIMMVKGTLADLKKTSLKITLKPRLNKIKKAVHSHKFITAGSILLTTLILGACAYFVFTAGPYFTVSYLHDFVADSGFWAPVVFTLIMIIQILIPVLPGGIVIAVGVLAFGPLWGFILNYIGTIVGCFMLFTITRRFGMRFIKLFVAPEKIAKYQDWLKAKRTERIFAIAILLPGAPDDLLCALAALTHMTERSFLKIIILLKPWSMILYSLASLGIFSFLGINSPI